MLSGCWVGIHWNYLNRSGNGAESLLSCFKVGIYIHVYFLNWVRKGKVAMSNEVPVGALCMNLGFKQDRCAIINKIYDSVVFLYFCLFGSCKLNKNCHITDEFNFTENISS